MTMNDKQLFAILQMPPDAWKNGEQEVAIRYGAYKEAAAKIERLERALDASMKRMFELDAFAGNVASVIVDGAGVMTPEQIIDAIKDELTEIGEGETNKSWVARA